MRRTLSLSKGAFKIYLYNLNNLQFTENQHNLYNLRFKKSAFKPQPGKLMPVFVTLS